MLELYNQKLIDLLVPYREDVSFDTENVSFLWDNKEIIVVNHRFVVIVQDLVHMSIFNLRLNYIGFVLLSFFVAGLSVMSALQFILL